MADDEAVRAAGETAVGDQRDVFSQTRSHDRGGRRQHFGHARTAFRAFVTDDDNVALLDLAALEALQHVLLTIVYARRPREAQAFLAGDLGHRAAGREVAAQNLDMATWLDRPFERHEHVLSGLEPRERGEILGDRLAGDGKAVAVNEILLEQIFHHRRSTSDIVQVFHHVFAGRLEIGQERHAVAHRLEILNGQRHAHGARHGNEMQHGVGRAAERHHDHHGVFEGPARHDVARFDVLFQQIPDGLAGIQALFELTRFNRGR